MVAPSQGHPFRIGIRREDKSEWERRVPLTPQDAAQLQEQGIKVRQCE